MLNPYDFTTGSITIIGLGISNLPLIEYLFRQGVERLTVRDKRDVFADQPDDAMLALKNDPRIEFIFGVHYLGTVVERAKRGDYIFKTPGIRRDIPELAAASAKGAFVTSEMEYFLMYPGTDNIIIVTGSQGKTTTTTLIGELLKAGSANLARKRGAEGVPAAEFDDDDPNAPFEVYVGGNIGKPLWDIKDKIRHNDFVVLELSSFQLFDLARAAFNPKRAVITNITPNHLDWHRDMDEYIRAKEVLLIHQDKRYKDRSIFNYDDPIVRGLDKKTNGIVYYFSMERLPNDIHHGAYLHDGALYLRYGSYADDVEVIKRSDIRLRGDHNVRNYLAAICAAFAKNGVSRECVKAVAESFGGVEHRNEFVRTVGGVEYYNSSIDSSPARTVAALSIFGAEKNKKIILILGGRDKKLDHISMCPAISEKVKAAVLYGEAAPVIDAALREGGADSTAQIIRAEGFDDACETARSLAVEGDVVLLAPACASFDCFKNFEERGKRFKEFVAGIE